MREMKVNKKEENLASARMIDRTFFTAGGGIESLGRLCFKILPLLEI